MMADLRAVLWRELKDIPHQYSGRRGGPWTLLVVIGIFGVFLPMQAGARFLDAGQLTVVVMLPVILIASVIADSFAGERERHTLETLLASPLSDQAILLGKVAAAVAWGWGVSLVCLALGVLTVNLRFGHGTLLMFTAQTGVFIVTLSFLLSLLMASAGVLISLRASTVRQAQQILSMGFIITVFAVVFGLRSLPGAWQDWMSGQSAGISAWTLIALGLGTFLLVDLVMLGVALVRFRRSRLVLD